MAVAALEGGDAARSAEAGAPGADAQKEADVADAPGSRAPAEAGGSHGGAELGNASVAASAALLPASAPEEATTIDHITAAYRLRAQGRPIVLPTEKDVQEYIANRDRPPPAADVMDIKRVKLSGGMQVREAEESDDGTMPAPAEVKEGESDKKADQVVARHVMNGAGGNAEGVAHPSSEMTEGETHEPIRGAAEVAATTAPDNRTASAHSNSGITPPTHIAPAHDTTTVPKSDTTTTAPRIPPRPPSPPKRRVRELRLDLRTLDAAALFQLETWRREVLGLDKMEMEHPDSIWFHEPTPEPEPSPEPEVVKKPRGRPKKGKKGEVSATKVEVDEDENRVETGGSIVIGGAQGASPIKVEEQAVSSEAAQAAAAIEKENDAENQESAQSRSPTPDVPQNIYTDDPDFVPAETPPPRPRNPGRPRKSAVNSTADTPSESNEPAQADSSSSVQIPPSEIQAPISRTLRERSSTRISRQSLAASATADIKVETSPHSLNASNKRRRISLSTSSSVSAAEKRRISIDGKQTLITTVPGYVADLATRQAKRARVVCVKELQSRRDDRRSLRARLSARSVTKAKQSSLDTPTRRPRSSRGVAVDLMPARRRQSARGRPSSNGGSGGSRDTDGGVSIAGSEAGGDVEVGAKAGTGEEEIDELDSTDDDDEVEGVSSGGAGVLAVEAENEEAGEWGFLRGV